jgi:hypothetical protein
MGGAARGALNAGNGVSSVVTKGVILGWRRAYRQIEQQRGVSYRV